MKLKLLQIVDAREPLVRLASEKYPAHIAYRIQRNIRALDPELRAFGKMRDELIRKYGEEIDPETKAGVFRVPPEKTDAYNAELSPLLDEQVDVDIRALSLDDIHDITPMDLMALEWMFDEPMPTPEIPVSSHRSRVRKTAQVTKPV